ncbi:MAG: class I SAM-dependent methyltransferase [Deltaproteobacteria bacterium]|nr:class I SAM-dependent methyltransferase [Deltaproteobacteria bacterium]
MIANFPGKELLLDPGLNRFHKLYIAVFGVPISGLRIRLRRILPAISGKYERILDLGCGRGIFTFELARRFPNAQVIGIDIDKKQIDINNEIAQQIGLKNVTFRVQDILTMEYKNAFDLILSVDNLEHISEDSEVLRKIDEALIFGGSFVCHVPAYERIWLLWGKSKNFDVEGHVRPGYHIEQLKKLIEEAGLHIKSINPTYGYLETVSNNISYLITGARQRNALLYAFAFPMLNAMAWMGRNAKPGVRGAGILTIASKKVCP